MLFSKFNQGFLKKVGLLNSENYRLKISYRFFRAENKTVFL